MATIEALKPIPDGSAGLAACLRGLSQRAGIAQQYGAYYPKIMRTISVKLPDDLAGQLAREAKARRVTKSQLVRESLEKGLFGLPGAGPVSCYDLAHDLAGVVRGCLWI